MIPVGYEINEHRHRFAVWAAARAAQRGFADVNTLRKALERCGVVEFVETANFDDVDDKRFDTLHRQWCSAIVDSLVKAGVAHVTYGRATKLIGMYLKSMVVLGPGSGTALARTVHPPVDGILLRKLAASLMNSEYSREWARVRWTKLTHKQYYELIGQLREALGPDEPFWKLERFWTVTDDEGP